jgi:predicted transcriptional regulator
MTNAKLTIHIGSLNDMGQRFVRSWHSAKEGEALSCEHITFLDLPSLLSKLSPKRLELLKALSASGPSSVRALALLMQRDYKSVHQDVAQLIAVDLITRQSADRVAVTWTTVHAELDLRAA